MKKLKISLLFLMFASIATAQWKQSSSNPNNDPANAAKQLLNPGNHVLVLIDHESQMAFAVESQPIEELRNNTGMIANLSKIYEIPTVVTTVAEKAFSGPVFPEVKEFFPDASKYIDRTTMNCWEDKRVVAAVTKFDKKKVVMAGLWTEVCTLTAALSAQEDGYEVYVITDASGGISKEAHDMAIARMMMAGIKPITSLQYALEVHRDWARAETYVAMNKLAMRWGGAYGLGIHYKKTLDEWEAEQAEKP